MEKMLRKPVTFILILALIISSACLPTFAAEPPASNSIYGETSLENGMDTGFEKQNEISDVKNASQDGLRTLSNDAHSGRFSLKIGKQGIPEKVLCNVINKNIDLTKYNQISMWIKPKGYNTNLTFYTLANNQSTTIGSIEVKDLKAEVWQEVTFSLSALASGNISGIYTWAYGNKTLLIDDIRFTKSYSKSETWNLNSSEANTLPTVMSYQDGVGVTLKNTSTSSAVYESGAKVASIENQVSGQITDIQIDSSTLNGQGTAASTSGATYINGIVATNPDLFTMSEDGNLIYYYNPITNSVERKNKLTNESTQIYNGQIKMIKTNEDGSMIAMVDTTSALYLVKDSGNSFILNSPTATLVTSGAISNLFFRDNGLFYVCDNILYILKYDNLKSVKITEYYYDGLCTDKIDPSDASLVYQSNVYKYYFSLEYSGLGINIWRFYNNINYSDRPVSQSITRAEYDNKTYSIVKANSSGSMVVFKNSNYYYLANAKNVSGYNQGSVYSLGYVNSLFFTGEKVYYSIGNDNYCMSSSDTSPTKLKNINYFLDSNESGDNLVFAENFSCIYLINNSYSFDKDLLFQFSTPAGVTIKPSKSETLVNLKFSTLPNQVIAQMENGDIYSVDTRTKTSRLLINNMVLYDVLDQGRLLLSDMKDTGRFLIYDPTSNSKEVFRLDNRSIGTAFTIQFNEADKTVYYLNKDNKMQELLLTGAETKDRYAFMMNNDNKWWVYKNNAWKTIYTGSDNPSVDLMDSQGMTASEVNALSEKDFQKLPENAKAQSLKIAVYFNSNSPSATPVLKNITVSTKDAETDLGSKTAYGTRIKEYNKADFRDVSAIHVTENKDSADEIYYFLVVNDTPYSIRNGETCSINQNATQFFSNVKDHYMDVMAYGMSAKELADMPADSLKQILITNNTTDKFGIVAVIKTVNKDTKEVKLDYVLESLQKRFDDSVTKVSITLTDDTLIQYTTPEVSKEEIEKFADWIMDRKYNRGPVFFTFHIGGKYKIINYYMIKMFTVE